MVAVIGLHAQSLNNDFKLDDVIYRDYKLQQAFPPILDQFKPSQTHHYNPIDKILNIFVFKALPLEPAFLRAVNLLLLLLNALLFYWTIKYLFTDKKIALLAALLLISHPFTAEIVGQITLNTILLNGLFVQGSFLLLCYSAAKRSVLYRVLSLFLFALSLLTWEGSILFSLVVVVYFYCVSKKSFFASVWTAAPYLGVSFLYFCLWRMLISPGVSLINNFGYLEITFGQYGSGLLQLIVWYFANLLFPNSIVFIFNVDPHTFSLQPYIIALLIGTLVSLIFIILKNRRGKETFYVFWILISLLIIVPASLAHSYMGMIIEPNWAFVSNLGFYALCAAGLMRLSSKISPILFKTTLIGVVGYCFIFSQWQHVVGRTDESYARNWAQACPTNVLALQLLGDSYVNLGMPEKAVNYYRKIIAHYQTIKEPGIGAFRVYIKYALTTIETGGDKRIAKKYIDKALTLNPGCTLCYNAWGIMAYEAGDALNAEIYFKKGLEHESSLSIHKNLAEFYLKEKLYFHAYQEFERVLERAYNERVIQYAQSKLDWLEASSLKN